MKNKYRIVAFLAVLPLIVSCIALIFLPDRVPMHYDIAGEIDRWGAKYQVLIIPAIIIGTAFFLLLMAKHYGSKKEAYNNEKVLLYASNALIIFLNMLCYYFLYLAFVNARGRVINQINSMQITFMTLGLLLIVLGNIMPKLKTNIVLGVRTKWSMENEQTWFKSQRFGGACFIIAGIIMMVINFATNSIIGTVVSFVAIAVATVASIIASYKYYLMYRK